MTLKKATAFVLTPLFFICLQFAIMAIIVGTTNDESTCSNNSNSNQFMNLPNWLEITGIVELAFFGVYLMIVVLNNITQVVSSPALQIQLLNFIQMLWIIGWSTIGLLTFLNTYTMCNDSNYLTDRVVWLSTYIILCAQTVAILRGFIIFFIPSSWFPNWNPGTGYEPI
jgi:hypothetical protein